MDLDFALMSLELACAKGTESCFFRLTVADFSWLIDFQETIFDLSQPSGLPP